MTSTKDKDEKMETLTDNAVENLITIDNIVDAVTSQIDEEDEIGAFHLFGVPMEQMTQSIVTTQSDLETVSEDALRSLSMIESDCLPNSAYSENEYGTKGPPAMALSKSMGGRMSTPYRQSGNAIDVIAVKSREDQFYTTSWHVRHSVRSI